MGLLSPRSEVVETDGWLWLAPRRRSVRRRHSLASFLLATLIWLGLMVFALVPPGVREVVIAPLAGLGVWLVLATARSGRTRLALSPIGVALQTGLETTQIGWPALRMIAGCMVRGRVRVLLGTGDQVHTTRETFDADAAREWLDRCAEEARRRNLDPQPMEQCLGWRAGA